MTRRRVMSILCSLILAAAAPAAAITIEFDPAARAVSVGDPVSFDLVVSGLNPGGGTSLGAFDVNIGFDPGILGFTSAAFGAKLGDEGLGEAVTGTDASMPGTVNLFEVSLLTAAELEALQAPSFVLATLGFTAKKAGASALDISVNALADQNGGGLQAEVASGRVLVEGGAVPIPEPRTLLLVGLGLLAITRTRLPRRGA